MLRNEVFLVGINSSKPKTYNLNSTEKSEWNNFEFFNLVT